jgi:hypothetical protein
MQTQGDDRTARPAAEWRTARVGAAAAIAGTRARRRGTQRGVEPGTELRAEREVGPGARPSAAELRATTAAGSGGSFAEEGESGEPGARAHVAEQEDAALFESEARGSPRTAPVEPGGQERAPLWFVGVVTLAGGLAWADGQRRPLQTPRDAASAARRASAALHGTSVDAPLLDVASAGPRELRRLPGIGDQRALALARARWQSGARAVFGDLDAQPGIGPITAGRVAAWLREAGLDAWVAPRAQGTSSESRPRNAAAFEAPLVERAAPHNSLSESSGPGAAPPRTSRVSTAHASAPGAPDAASPGRAPPSTLPSTLPSAPPDTSPSATPSISPSTPESTPPISAPSTPLGAWSAAGPLAPARTAVGDGPPWSPQPTARRAASTSGASPPPRVSATAPQLP